MTYFGTGSGKIETLADRLKFATAKVLAHRITIETAARDISAIGDEIAELDARRLFLQRALSRAPEALRAAQSDLAALQTLDRQQRARALSGGLRGGPPSRATLERKVEKARSLREQLSELEAELESSGINPETGNKE